MKKICGIYDVKNPVLKAMLDKYGPVQGLDTYYRAKEVLKLEDKLIKAKYLPETLDTTGKSKESSQFVKKTSDNPINNTAKSLEESSGLATYNIKKGQATRIYKPMGIDQAIAKTTEVNKLLREQGLSNTYQVVRRSQGEKFTLKLVAKNQANSYETSVVYLVPQATAPFVKVEEERLRELYKKKRSLSNEIANEGFGSRLMQLNKELDLVEAGVKSTEKKLNSLQDLDSVDKLFRRAEADEKALEEFFSKPNYTYQELLEATILYDTWAIESVKPGLDHPYLDSMEQRVPSVVNNMNAISSRVATRFGALINSRIKEAVINSTRKHSNISNMTNQEIFDTMLEDSGTLRSELLNAGKQVSPIIQAAFNNVNKANNQAHSAAFDRIQLLKEKAKGMRNSDFKRLYQTDSTGRLTGELMQPASSDYIQELRSIQERLDYGRMLLQTSSSANDKKKALNTIRRAIADMRNFHMQNSAPINIAPFVADLSSFEGSVELPDIIFANTEEVANPNEIKADLEKRFGKAEANRMLKKAAAMAREFISERDALIAELIGENNEISESNLEYLKRWSLQNSPFLAYNYFTTGSATSEDMIEMSNFRYVAPIPNEATMDPAYKDMINNEPDVLEFYNVVVDLINEGRSEIGDIKGYLTGMSLPLMKDAFFSSMLKGAKFAPKLMEAFRDTIAIENQEDYRQKDLHKDVQNIVNAKEINTTAVSRYPIEKQVREEYARLLAEYVSKNGEASVTTAVKSELRKDAVNNVYTSSSSNLVAIMSMVALNTQTIRAKRVIEPQIKLVERLLKDESSGNKIEQTKAIGALDYFLDREFYGIPSAENVGKGGIPIKNKEEKEKAKAIKEQLLEAEMRIDELEEKVDNNEILSDLEEKELEGLKLKVELYEADLEKLGKRLSASKAVDGALGLTQLIGIGFSAVSATGNVGIGYLANQMLAAEGRDLGADSLARAYGFIIGGNTVRFLTFGKLDKVIPSKHRDKISNIIARNQMVASIFDEINHNTSKLTGKQKGAFRSSNLMEKSEFVNQAAIVVGMMLDTKVTMKDGSTRNLYEVFNQEGVPSTDIVSYQTKNAKESKPWNADEFFQYAKHVIEETHGDYNHSVKFKGKTLGKLLSTFRTWMYRTTANRYEPEYYDSISGYTRKGKYRSAAGIFQSLPLINKIPVLNKIMPPVVFANSGFDNRH